VSLFFCFGLLYFHPGEIYKSGYPLSRVFEKLARTSTKNPRPGEEEEEKMRRFEEAFRTFTSIERSGEPQIGDMMGCCVGGVLLLEGIIIAGAAAQAASKQKTQSLIG